MEQFLVVDGVIAAQTVNIEIPFKEILPEFSTIIEIGFDRGGFSKWLNYNKKPDTKLVSYDISFNSKLVDDGIDFRLGDCFDPTVIAEITQLINSSGKTLVLCDGGNKEKEFMLYSKHLKPNDVIMLHDYAHSDADYNDIKLQIGWKTGAESKYQNIKNAVHENNLSPYHYEKFKNVLWGAFFKLNKNL